MEKQLNVFKVFFLAEWSKPVLGARVVKIKRSPHKSIYAGAAPASESPFKVPPETSAPTTSGRWWCKHFPFINS